MVIQVDEIRGVHDGLLQIMCIECFEKSKQDFEKLAQEEIITSSEIDSDDSLLWFCDECNKQL